MFQSPLPQILLGKEPVSGVHTIGVHSLRAAWLLDMRIVSKGPALTPY